MHKEASLYHDFHNFIDSINENEKNNKYRNIDRENLLCLYSREIPNISIHMYIDRILDNIDQANTHMDGILIYAIALLLRIIKYISIDNYNIHRLIAGILMLSQKIYDDTFYSNEYWAFICGVPLENINKIELFILLTLDFNLFVKHEEMISITKSIKHTRSFDII